MKDALVNFFQNIVSQPQHLHIQEDMQEHIMYVQIFCHKDDQKYIL